jgi:hypothetical protein
VIHVVDVTVGLDTDSDASELVDDVDDRWYCASLRAARIELMQYDPRRRAMVNAARGAVMD